MCHALRAPTLVIMVDNNFDAHARAFDTYAVVIDEF